eukprot:TRINITY_DN2085_c0_g1::TRINITY_DN2085_c0_g1_i2::g.21744::m.21744 TRINITY_DN2085_c0_g1::TRINITY_DN2085_c0_g1_i2::g.21744  ORF type:complete len:111 (+),score=3.56,GIY-YIG/PF01541.19/0.004,SprT-like/PF10263.4/0.021 TRINITY_DN2085_c0_g1_i2:929-1261(+)
MITHEIYHVRNMTTGREYVGYTAEGHGARWRQHVLDAWDEESPLYLTPLHRAIRLYGGDAMEVSLLMSLSGSDSYARQVELSLIREMRTAAPEGYNLLGGEQQVRILRVK